VPRNAQLPTAPPARPRPPARPAPLRAHLSTSRRPAMTWREDTANSPWRSGVQQSGVWTVVSVHHDERLARFGRTDHCQSRWKRWSVAIADRSRAKWTGAAAGVVSATRRSTYTQGRATRSCQPKSGSIAEPIIRTLQHAYSTRGWLRFRNQPLTSQTMRRADRI
jgi:hypothetical protein